MANLNKKIESRIIPEATHPKFYARNFKPYEFIGPKIKEKDVLEIGCGDGYGSDYLAKISKRVTAVDYEEDVILQAKDKYKSPNLKFLSMDATNLGLKDNTFDVVCSFQVIEHIPEGRITQFLSEIKRVLRLEGKLYLSTLNLSHVMKNPQTYKKNPAHCKEFTFEEFKTLVSGVFHTCKFYGLRLTIKHEFFLKLKRIGILNLLPGSINPVSRFYNKVTTEDFKVLDYDLQKASDFICICSK